MVRVVSTARQEWTRPAFEKARSNPNASGLSAARRPMSSMNLAGSLWYFSGSVT